MNFQNAIDCSATLSVGSVSESDRYAARAELLMGQCAKMLAPPPVLPDSNNGAASSAKRPVPELRRRLRSRPGMRIVHRHEGMAHCVLGPEPQVERLF